MNRYLIIALKVLIVLVAIAVLASAGLIYAVHHGLERMS